MSEGAKTLTFVGVAVGLLIVAVATQPRAPRPQQADQVGSLLNEVEDPLAATRLQVINFKEDTSSLSTFEVAKLDGVWVIPSHQNYPADAQQQMADAATSVMNLQVLRVASTNAADHETFGVIDPDIEKLKPGTVGVGSRVTMQDSGGDQLVHMIIGKEVKDQQGQRYVREVGRDPVYVVKLDSGKLTTKFEDWIEKDLLKLNPYDIAEVTLKDYTAELAIDQLGRPVVVPDRQSQMTFAFNDTDSKWAADALTVFNKQEKRFEPFTLAEDEEVDSDKLNELKSALDDLKIVDVERKPEALSLDLQAGEEFVKDLDAVRNLAGRGFFPPILVASNAREILSSDGDVVCQMKDGVEYVLHFGKIVLGADGGGQETSKDKQEGASGDAADENGEADGNASADGGGNINRYVFVTTRFNEDAIEKPKTEALPELPEGVTTEELGDEMQGSDQADAAATPETGSEGPPAAETSPDTASEGGPDAAAGSETNDAPGDTSDSGAADRPAATTRIVQAAYQADGQDADAAADDAAAAETVAQDDAADSADGSRDTAGDESVETTESATATEPETDAQPSSEGEATGDTTDAEGGPAADTADKQDGSDKEEPSLDELIARRKEIEQENQRKLDEYSDKIKKGKERVDELNKRFGDWYYVISDSVFQKIHLNRGDVIKKKEAEADETGAGTENNADAIAPAGPLGQLDEIQKAVGQDPPAMGPEGAAAEDAADTDTADTDTAETDTADENTADENTADTDTADEDTDATDTDAAEQTDPPAGDEGPAADGGSGAGSSQGPALSPADETRRS